MRFNINYLQDDWTLHLPVIEFEYNNVIYLLTEQTLFYANNEYHLKLHLLNR